MPLSYKAKEPAEPLRSLRARLGAFSDQFELHETSSSVGGQRGSSVQDHEHLFSNSFEGLIS